jgi:hypothetical protein
VVDDADWRSQGQERYLQGVALQRASYSPRRPDWEHDHCEFCGAKFGDRDLAGALTEGFATADRYRWVCETCFRAFRERFGWSLIEADA